MGFRPKDGSDRFLKSVLSHNVALRLMKPEDRQDLQAYIDVTEEMEFRNGAPSTLEAQEAFDVEAHKRVSGSRRAMNIYTTLVDRTSTSGSDS